MGGGGGGGVRVAVYAAVRMAHTDVDVFHLGCMAAGVPRKQLPRHAHCSDLQSSTR